MGPVFKVILGLLLVGSCRAEAFEIPDLKNLNRLTDANNQFAVEMYHELKDKSSDGNMIYSPFSLRTVMAMLQAGAEGESNEEIKNAMHFPENSTELFVGYREFLKLFQEGRNVTLQTANRIYLKEGFEIKENFQKTLQYFFKSRCDKLDFTKSKKAAETINNWVAEKTEQKIRNLVNAGQLNNQTKMVLVNALYFKGSWDIKFFGKATKKKPFFKNEKDSQMVDTMNTVDYFRVVELPELNSKGIVLPYEGKKVEMIILLPNEKTGLKSLEDSLKTLKFSQISEQINEKSRLKNIVLNLPKFRIDSSLDLIDPLKKLKMTQIFDEEKANFAGIPETEVQLSVSKTIQKAFVEVNEEGTEAGAATFASIFTPLSIGPPVEETINVDRPFMGLIRDKVSNTILFLFKKTTF